MELLASRESEHALRQAHAATDAAERVADKPVEAFGKLGVVTHELKVALHGHQQVVEVVRNAAGELPHRFEFLRLEQGFAGLFQCERGCAPLRDIARYFGE